MDFDLCRIQTSDSLYAAILRRTLVAIAVAIALTLPSLLCRAQTPVSLAHAKNAAWPDALVCHNGTRVRSAQQFLALRRPELLRDFEENVYGRTPRIKLQMTMSVTSVDRHALNGLAVRKQITIVVTSPPNSRQLHLLLYLPAAARRPVPVFVGLNFDGNQSVSSDPGIDLNEVWVPDPVLASTPVATELAGHIRRLATEASRGADASQWPLDMILKAGYGVATIYAGDIEPDFAAGIGYGVRPLFFTGGQRLPNADDWGAIGAWAWGMSRMVDYLKTDPDVDGSALIAIGHSRFGKTALWAGAQDTRFAMVISNESGQGGATLSHRQVGEPIGHLNIAFPYWFCANYHHFTGRAEQLPVDGHLLLALIAPRPLFVASALADPFSDHEGEFLSAVAASKVYALFGEQGISANASVVAGKSIGKVLRYYVRAGGHDILPEDWEQYIEFANQELPSHRQAQ